MMEDETDIANLVVRPRVFEQQRRTTLAGPTCLRIWRAPATATSRCRTDGEGDELHHGSPGVDPRSMKGAKARDIGNASGISTGSR